MTHLVIVQRQTLDWTQLSDQQFHEQSVSFCRLWGKPSNTVWDFFQLWNQTFSIDYREVRHRLKQHSIESIKAVKQSVFVEYQSYSNIPKNGHHYVFMDDDDWIDPEAAIKLEKYKNKLVLWRSANIGSPKQDHAVFVWGMNGRCMTNNYAVHRDYLQPFNNIEKVIQHKDACRIFENEKNIPHLDCALTVSNKSPISSVSLERGLEGELSSDKLQALIEYYVRRIESVCQEDLAYIPWASVYLEKAHSLFFQVKQSSKS